MYFKNLGTTEYENKTIPDILKRIVLTNNLQTSNLFEKYEVSEGQTPESLSFSYYGLVDYYWVILLTNSIKSRYFDWPMGSQEINQHTISKYGNKSALFFRESSFNNVFNFCDVKYVARGQYIFKVLGCDRNLNKLEIEKARDTELRQKQDVSWLTEDYTILSTVKIDRIVYENETSLHHFEDLIYTRNSSTTVSTGFSPIAESNPLGAIATNHRILLDRYISGFLPTGAVTNIEHEIKENDKKRQIYLIKPEYVNLFVSEFRLLSEV